MEKKSGDHPHIDMSAFSFLQNTLSKAPHCDIERRVASWLNDGERIAVAKRKTLKS
jgi:hypothetical protein